MPKPDLNTIEVQIQADLKQQNAKIQELLRRESVNSIYSGLQIHIDNHE